MFEEVFISLKEAELYRHAYPCKSCDAIARRVLSSTNFQFTGTPGQSGSHDLDYPTLDKAVGRSSAEKWKNFHEKKEKRDKIRRESGQHAVTQVGDNVVPTSPERLKLREQSIQAFNAARKSKPND
jgi:hypothetical protein